VNSGIILVLQCGCRCQCPACSVHREIYTCHNPCYIVFDQKDIKVFGKKEILLFTVSDLKSLGHLYDGRLLLPLLSLRFVSFLRSPVSALEEGAYRAIEAENMIEIARELSQAEEIEKKLEMEREGEARVRREWMHPQDPSNDPELSAMYLNPSNDEHADYWDSYEVRKAQDFAYARARKCGLNREKEAENMIEIGRMLNQVEENDKTLEMEREGEARVRREWMQPHHPSSDPELYAKYLDPYIDKHAEYWD
jgi:hypothetical protein